MLYTNTTKEMQKKHILIMRIISQQLNGAGNITHICVVQVFCSSNLYIVYSTVSTLYYLTIISNMCYILQILFVSEMVNNFY